MNEDGKASDKQVRAEPRRKLDVLQAGRGVAAFAVLLFHANIVYALAFTGGERPFPILALGSVGVEYFFVLSGFIMMLVHRRDLGVPARFGNFVLSRVVRIFPIFWIIFTLLLAGEAVMGLGEESLTGPASYVWAYLLLPFEGPSPLTAAWTLSHELLFYLIFGLAILNRTIGFAILWAWTLACIAITAAYLTGSLDLVWPADFVFSVYNVFFAFGILSATAYRSVSVAGAYVLLAAGAILFAAAGALQVGWNVPNLTAAFGLAAVLAITGLVRLETEGLLRIPPSLVWLGDASYSLYLVHGPVLVLITLILRKAGLAAGLGAGGSLAVMIVSGLLAGMAFYVIVERPMLRVLSKRLLGRPREAGIPVGAARTEAAG